MVDPLDNLNDDAGDAGNSGDEALKLPAALVAKLKADATGGQPDWSRVDAKVLGAAAEHFASDAFTQERPVVAGRIGQTGGNGTGSDRGGWRINRFIGVAAGFAAAAMVGIVLWIQSNSPRDATAPQNRAINPPSTHQLPSLAALPGDVNGDGRVDILDAYVLQRRLETAAALEARWDINGDGRVDAQDVDAIAVESVKLDGGPRL